jgi:photosynthetic reaction center cytochrome c subunit
MRVARPTIISALIALLSVATALSLVHAQSAPSPPKLAEEQFKNIQALKATPADQVIPAMQFISASLGVECEYCHVHGANEKDDKKPKLAARKMISMVFAINKDNFDGRREVTCYSCHRGATEPVGTPIITAMESKPEGEATKPPEQNPALPPADKILDNYLAAIGGPAALERVSTRVQKGTVAFGGQRFPADIYAKAPGKRVAVMHLKDGDSTTAFDGKTGWLVLAGRPPHRMSPSENEAARMDADLLLAEHLKSQYAKFHTEPGERIEGHDTYEVVGRNEDQPPLRLYFDRQSGLLLRLVRYAESPLGRNPTQIDFADYREADGLKLPFRWTVARPGNRFTLQVEQLRQNVLVDDTIFMLPWPTPSPQKPPSQ